MFLGLFMEREELIEKYGIDIKSLEQEQIKLAKSLEIKDIFDSDVVSRIGSIVNIIVKNKIISAMVVVDAKDYEILDQAYFLDTLRFPYLHGFKAYRELPVMTGVYSKIKEKPDVVLIKGEGINHSRLGIASHFSVATGVPAIGISDKLFDGNIVVVDDVLMDDKKVGCVVVSKKGAKPLYICPGDKVSVKGACEMIEKMVIPPHKMPEPLHIAHRYSKDIKKELGM